MATPKRVGLVGMAVLMAPAAVSAGDLSKLLPFKKHHHAKPMMVDEDCVVIEECVTETMEPTELICPPTTVHCPPTNVHCPPPAPTVIHIHHDKPEKSCGPTSAPLEAPRSPQNNPTQPTFTPAAVMVPRQVMVPETVMVPATVMVPQTVMRPQTIMQRMDGLAIQSGVSQASFNTPTQNQPSSGLSDSDFNRLASLLQRQPAAASAAAPAASVSSSDLDRVNERIDALEKRLDCLIDRLEEAKNVNFRDCEKK